MANIYYYKKKPQKEVSPFRSVLGERKSIFPSEFDMGGIVFRYTGFKYDNHDLALNEKYFRRQRGYYVRIVKRKGYYGIYQAKKE